MSDNFAPAGGRVVHPDGTVSYDFDGHVSAQGVDILGADNSTPPSDRKVRWHKDTIAGTVIAEIVGGSVSPTEGFLTLQAWSASTHANALLQPSADGDDSQVRVDANGMLVSSSAVLLNNHGGSTFTRSLSGRSVNEDFSLLARTTISAFAGATGFGGFAYTFALPFTFPNAITGCWIDGINPQDARLQMRAQANGTTNSVGAWFYNGTGANQNLTADLYIAGN